MRREGALLVDLRGQKAHHLLSHRVRGLRTQDVKASKLAEGEGEHREL